MFIRLTQNKSRGANLVELALVFPFVLIFMFMIVEIGRAWQTYEALRGAANDGAYTASINQNPAQGQAQIQGRLQRAGITPTTALIIPILTRDGTGSIKGYRASVQATYTPIMSNFWGIRIFPSVPMAINEVFYNNVY